jgi:uncharacterized membrane protein YoaK (UPF0700 family)
VMHNELMTSTPDQALKIRTRDILLNALAVSSGAIDAVSFLDLGKVFSAFMTGNIAFLGLRTAHATGPDWTNIFAAVFGIWSQRVTVALCVSLIAHATFLSVWFASNGRPSVGVVPVLLGSWGFAMGMQSAAVRRLHVDGVFTTAATATIIFLAGDLANWPATTKEMQRLTGVLASLFVGATAGGLLSVHAHIYAPVLPFMITVVVVATAAFALGNLDAEGAEEAQPPATHISTRRVGTRRFPSRSHSN